MIDAVEGLTSQDAHVAGYAVEEGKGLVVAVNKWDLVAEKTDKTFDQYIEWIRNEVPFLDFAPIVSISAKTGQRVGRVLEAAVDIWAERRRRIPTGELNRVLMAATERTPPPPVRGKRPEALLRDAGGHRAADVRVLRVGRLADPLLVPALPREPAARDVRVRRHADPARVPRPGVGEAAAAQEVALGAGQGHATAERRPDPPVALMPGPRVAVVGAGAWGTTLAAIVAKREPVVLLCHSRRGGRRRSRGRAATSGGCPGSTCRMTSIATADPADIAAADLVIFATPSLAPAIGRGRAWRRTSRPTRTSCRS